MGTPLDQIPGIGTLEKATSVLEHVVSDVGDLIDAALKHDPVKSLTQLFEHASKAVPLVPKLLSFTYKDVAGFAPMTIYKDMLHFGLGLDEAKIEADAGPAVKTVDDMLTFAFVLPVVFGAMGALIKALFGQRASEYFDNVLGKIPEEIGVTWALGQQIDRAFETAVGTAIEEAINVQKHPTRLEWPVLRQLLRQKAIKEPEARTYLDKLGYPDDLKDLIIKLDTAQLAIGDLATLYRYGVYARPQVEEYLGRLGFSDEDVGNLLTLYIDKAQTSAGQVYRSTARELFRSQLIPEGVYEDILQQTNTPDMDIQDDLAAITLEQKAGRIAASLSSLKTGFQHGVLHAPQVSTRLAQLGYSGQAIADTLAAWGEGPLPHPMSAAKVLTYWYSGVISDRTDALNRLIATHLTADDAAFLLDHPTAGGVRIHRLTPALVTQAYLAGVIDAPDLAAAYAKAGLDSSAVTYQIGVANYRKARQKHFSGPTLPLTAAEIRDGFKYGLETADGAIGRLEAIGYSPDDALFLLELTAKGPFDPNAKAAPSTFGSLEAAIAFLQQLGYTVESPPDPRIAEAESLVEQAGYLVIPPLGGTPPSYHGPSGGTPPYGRPNPPATPIPGA